MIAADTSVWIAYLEGAGGEDIELLDRALRDRQVLMAPAVLTELLSDSKLSPEVSQTLLAVPLAELKSGYWQRAGALRAQALAKRRRARLGDVLIAQTCMDSGIPLITRDRDFLAFAEAAGLDFGNRSRRGLSAVRRLKPVTRRLSGTAGHAPSQTPSADESILQSPARGSFRSVRDAGECQCCSLWWDRPSFFVVCRAAGEDRRQKTIVCPTAPSEQY